MATDDIIIERVSNLIENFNEHKTGCAKLGVIDEKNKQYDKLHLDCENFRKEAIKRFEDLEKCVVSKTILTPKLILYYTIGVFALGLFLASFTRLPELLLANQSAVTKTGEILLPLVK